MLKIKKILLLVILFSYYYVSAQTDFENLTFVKLRSEIAKNPITAIVQDEFGFVWIGTSGSGLYRYDGLSLTGFEHDWNDASSLNSDFVNVIYIDSENRIWIGTDAGMNLHDPLTDTFKTVKSEKPDEVDPSSFNISSIIQKSDNELLVGTYYGGLHKVDIDSFTIDKLDEKTINRENVINSLAKDSKNNIYIGSNSGLMLLDQSDGRLKNMSFSANEQSDDSDRFFIESVVVDNDDNLWIGTKSNGLQKWDGKTLKQYPITSRKILSLLTMGSVILVGTENDGLLVVDKNGVVNKTYINDINDPSGLSSSSIWSLLYDNENRLWVGSFNHGIEIYDDLYSKFGSITSDINNENSLQHPSVKSIQGDKDGKLWICTVNGIDIYNQESQLFQRISGYDKVGYSGLGTELFLECLFLDSNDNKWLGSWEKGIYFLENESKSFINYTTESTGGDLATNSIRDFSEDSKGRIWIGSFQKGLHYFDPKTKKIIHCNTNSFIETELIKADVKVVLADSNGSIWVGTTGGLYRVTETAENEFKAELLRNAVSEVLVDHPSVHQILAIYETHDKNIWIGSSGGEPIYFDYKDNSFHKYTAGITKINSFIEDKDLNLWVSSELGISKIDFYNNKTTNFNEDDGLLGNYFSPGAAYRDTKGRLFFGGNFGINYINPANIKFNNREPVLYFSGLKLFNKPVEIASKNSPLSNIMSQTSALELKHNQSVFTIEYAGVNHTRAEKNEYAYKLEGFDTDWNYVGSTKNATYTNLKAGDYNFLLKASNNDGVWTEKPLQLEITVLPPWWKTNIAYAIYVLTFLLIVSLIYTIVKSRFKEKQAIQTERNMRIQEEELHKAQVQFFTNISHEFRTPLTLIMNPITDLIKKDAVNGSDDYAIKHQIIYKNADKLSRLINELMDFRKLQSNKIFIKAKKMDVIHDVKEVLAYFEEEAGKRDINLSLNSSVQTLEAWLDPSMFEKIMFNILSNAFKVTPNKGSITVFVDETFQTTAYEDQQIETFQIAVEDTGPGIDQKEYKNIFKRFYQVSQLNKNYYGSTGIGLEMVKEFVNLHKGSIDVDSELDRGTTFKLTFMLGKEHFSKAELFVEGKDTVFSSGLTTTTYSNELARGVVNPDLGQDKSILIVEDNADLLAYLESELAMEYKVLTASNGKEGLETALKIMPDLIITDVVMPAMDGIELCEKIKVQIQTSHIPILMLSAKAMVEDKLKGIDAGADAYLSKPFNMDLVKATLKQLVTTRQVLIEKYTDNDKIEKTENTTTIDHEFIQQVLAYVLKNIEEPNLSVELLASEFFLSRSQLYRKIKALTSFSPNEFIRKVRLEEAKKILESGKDYNVTEVVYKVGFSSPSYFTKCYKATFGHLPKMRNV